MIIFKEINKGNSFTCSSIIRSCKYQQNVHSISKHGSKVDNKIMSYYL